MVRLFEGCPSSWSGQPSSPTIKTRVFLVILWRGFPPCLVTSANASARFIEASLPVKAMIPPSSDVASGSHFGFSVLSSSSRLLLHRRGF